MMIVCLLVLESVISDNLPSEVWCEAGNYNLGPGPSSESVWPSLSRSQTSIEASKTNLATLGLPRSSRGSCITGWRRAQVWAWCLYWWESLCTKCTQASSLLPSSHVSQGLVLVYVTAILVIMARQFRRLDTIEEDINRCLVVNSQGNTKVETVR